MIKCRYEKPQPYFGSKRVCFECIQHGFSQSIIVVMSNHKGFLCEACAETSASSNVKLALFAYRARQVHHQPFIGDLVEEILRISDSGFKGDVRGYFEILRNGDKYNHLLMDNVRIALELLADEGILSELESFPPLYFDPEKQSRTKI